MGRAGKTHLTLHVLFSHRTHLDLPLKKQVFAQTERLRVIAPQGHSALAQSSSCSLSGCHKGFQENILLRWLLWPGDEGLVLGMWRMCLDYTCQHLADTQAKQEPLKEKAEKGNSRAPSQQQVRRTRLGEGALLGKQRKGQRRGGLTSIKPKDTKKRERWGARGTQSVPFKT